jgi:hypothetical protein
MRYVRQLNISPDGKILTVAVKGTNAQGQALNNFTLFVPFGSQRFLAFVGRYIEDVA